MTQALPQEMTAIHITEPGGPEVLKPGQRPLPELCDGEVLIKVAAAGVNRPDVMQRQGNYPPPKGAPDTPGLEVAGTIVALSDDVTGWAIGDEICALVAGGGYAQYCAAPALQCLPVPKNIPLMDLLYRLGQCLYPRRAICRRNNPDSWRLQRYRHNGYSVGRGDWRNCLYHRRV